MQESAELPIVDADVQIEDAYVRLTIVGDTSLTETGDRIDAAINYSREIGKPRLLADVRSATGFGTPNVVERSHLIERWAASASSDVKLAIIARPEIIDPDRIGVTIARNRFFKANVFEDESSALAWLLR